MQTKEAKNRVRKVNDHFFSEWNDRSAYLLGYLEADGYFKVDKETLRVQFSVSIKDLEFLEELKKLVEFDGKITIKTHQLAKSTHKTASFTISSRQWKQDLDSRYRTGKIPACISEELLPHYIRGYFDGDGSVYPERTKIFVSFVSSSKLLLVNLLEKISEQIGSSKGMKIYKKSSSNYCWYFRIAKQELVSRFGVWIYKEANYFLARKRERFASLKG